MKPHHITLLTSYLTFLVGMVTGAALAHNPVLWIATIVLSALAIGLMGVPLIKPCKKRLPVCRASRIVRKVK
jgi:hypothetical protein